MINCENELIKTLMEALAIDSVQSAAEEGAPFGGGNLRALKHALSVCEKMGMTTVNLDGYCGYADVGEGEAFGVLGHLDTVPIGKGWTKNPYGQIEDGVIYGRGTMDDKGPMYSCMFALKSLLDEGLKPKRKIRFIFGCNEESGWGCIDRYNQTEQMPESGFSPDADFPVINCEKGIVNYRLTAPYEGKLTVTAGERANVVPDECAVIAPASYDSLLTSLDAQNVEYRVEDDKIYYVIKGLAAHAARPQEGKNAIIAALKSLTFDSKLSEIYTAFSSYDGEGCGLNLSDEQSGGLTVNLGIISAEVGQISFTVDIRYPITVEEERIAAHLRKTFKGYTVEKTHHHFPLFVEKENRLVQTLLDSYEAVTGERPLPLTIGGGTYARAMRSGVAFGPQFPSTPTTIHQADERVSIAELSKMTQIYREALKALCF